MSKPDQPDKQIKKSQPLFLQLSIICLLVMSEMVYSEDVKLAQTGFKFLSVGSNARGTGLADAMTVAEIGSGAILYNPAGMARMDKLIDMTIGQNNWIDNIKYNQFTLGLSPWKGRYGVFGVSFTSVDYGAVQGTMVSSNAQGYVDTDVLYPTAMALGVGYAKTLTNKFAVGGHVKVAGQYLGKNVVPAGEEGDSLKVKQNSMSVFAYDFGTIYRTGFRSLVFGMAVNNFSREIKYEQENFELPLTFKIGLSYNLLDLLPARGGAEQLTLSMEATHPRDYPEELNLGLEYNWREILWLRGGYKLVSDEQDFTFGFGLRKYGLGIDYAYAPFGVFDNVQMFTLSFAY